MATPSTGVGRGGGGRQVAGLSRPAFRRKLAGRAAREVVRRRRPDLRRHRRAAPATPGISSRVADPRYVDDPMYTIILQLFKLTLSTVFCCYIFKHIRIAIKHLRDITILVSFGWITCLHSTLPVERGSLPKGYRERLILGYGRPIHTLGKAGAWCLSVGAGPECSGTDPARYFVFIINQP